MSKFKKPEANPLLNPVDYFNLFGKVEIIFAGSKNVKILDDNSVILPPKDGEEPTDEPTFTIDGLIVTAHRKNPYKIDPDTTITKFMLLTAVRFKGDYNAAISYVYFDLMKCEVPYIRVGTDYYKVIKKTNRFNTEVTTLKHWRKEEIKQDHGKDLFNIIYKFDDFTIEPDNINFAPAIKNCYNLYNPFPHRPVNFDVFPENIPNTMSLLTHIFGEQLDLGLKYMKVLYEYPKQILPVLALTSTERETGKTTFLNWVMMLFGENSILINPNDISSNFNESYALKNVIMIDETVIDKTHTIEKLKSIATAKSLSVSQKYISSYTVPFFGKVIVCTNKETDFMRIDEEEIRFWVRKIGSITKKNTRIEFDLFDEVPLFLRYLSQLPAIDFSKSRMVFTQEEIKAESLANVKEESKSTLRKEIEYLIRDLFDNHPSLQEIELTPKDIKDKWFHHNNTISVTYIRKVLKEEMKLPYSVDVKRYRGWPDSGYDINLKTGRVYYFKNENYNPSSMITVEEDFDQPF